LIHAELKETILSDKVLTALAFCLIVVNGLDVGTTLVALEHGAQELNPMVKGIVGNTALLVILKAIGVGIILYMTKFISENTPQYPKIGYIAISLTIGVIAGAVINNLLALKGMGVL